MHGSIDTNCLGLIIEEQTSILTYKKNNWDINVIFL